jgi:hypothetical protein
MGKIRATKINPFKGKFGHWRQQKAGSYPSLNNLPAFRASIVLAPNKEPFTATRRPCFAGGIAPYCDYYCNFVISIFLNSTSEPSACKAIWPLVAVQL